MNLVEYAAAAFREVLVASLFGSILALVIVALQFVLRRRLDAAWRHAIWMIVLVRLTVPALPESPLSLFNVPRWVMADKDEKPRVTVTLAEPTPSDARPIQIESESVDLPIPGKLPVKTKSISLFETVALAWFSISVLLLVRLLIGSCWLHFQLMKNARIADSSLVHILTRARSEVRTLWNPRPIESAVVHSPGLFGCFRPKLLLPVGITSHLSETELRHIFLHELAHLKRGDLWVNLLLSVVQALHWFNPCVWLVTRRVRLERELACDALVMRATPTTETRAYGETILKLLERLSVRPAFSSVVGILEEKQSAAARLNQIAQFSSKRPPSRVLCFLVLASLVLIGLSNAQTQKHDTAEPLQTNVPVDRQSTVARLDTATAGVEVLEKEYGKQTARVEKLQRELDDLRSELNLTEPQDRSTFVAAEELSRIQQDLSSATARYVHYKALVDALKGKTRKELRKLIPTASPDAAMDRYLGDLAKAEQRYAANINNLGPEHPEIANIVEVMKTVNQQIEDRIEGVLAGLDLQVTQCKALVDELQGMAKERQASANDKRLTSYFAAKRSLENEQRTRDMIYMRILEKKVDAQIPVASVNVAPLIHDARLLIELGQYDQAEAKLSQALKQDPANDTALNMKALLNEKRSMPKDFTNRPEGQIDLRKSPSKNVVSDVSEQIEASTLIENARLFLELGKTNEAEKRLKFALQIDPGNKLATERLAQLDSTPKNASKAPEAALQAPGQPLRTRTYRINPNTMLDAVFERNDFGNPALPKGRTVPVPLEPDVLQASIREFFAKAGFKTDAVPPGGTPSQNRNAIFFNDRTGVLMVRGTLADLDVVENTVQKMSLVPAQVTIETKVIEIKPGAAYEEELLLRTIATNKSPGVITVTQLMSDPQFKAVVSALENRQSSTSESAEDGTSSSGILTEPEYWRILAALEKRKGVSVLAAPKVTTLSNRAARISVDPGPTVDINALVEPDRQSIRLTAEAIIASKLPQLPEVKAKASHRLRDGQTIAIWPKQNPGNNVVIFVTATVIDSAGNRVNDPTTIPDSILPQQKN